MVHKSMAIPCGEPGMSRVSEWNEIKLAKEDAERMEQLNRQIALEPKKKKYSYRRTHTNTAPGQPCSICGRTFGPCKIDMPTGE